MSARTLNLLFDLAAGYPNNNVLVKSFTDPSVPSMAVVAGDEFQLNLYPMQRAATVGAPPTTDELPAGQTIIFTIKPTAGLAGEAIALASGFTGAQDEDDDWYYAAQVAISLANFNSLAGGAATLACTGEILIQDPDTEDEQRFQFPVTVLSPAYRGTESVPAASQFAFFSSAESDARYPRMDSGLYGSQAVASGQLSATVDSLSLPFVPATFLCWLTQNGGGTPAAIAPQCDDSTISAAGFTANFTGETPDNLHTLHWIALPAPSSFTTTSPGLRPSGQTVTVSGTAATVDLTLPGMILLNMSGATGTVALTLNNPVAGAVYIFEVAQGSTARGLTFPSNTLQRGGGGGTYTPSGANAKDVIRMLYDGTNFLISVEDAYA